MALYKFIPSIAEATPVPPCTVLRLSRRSERFYLLNSDDEQDPVFSSFTGITLFNPHNNLIRQIQL